MTKTVIIFLCIYFFLGIIISKNSESAERYTNQTKELVQPDRGDEEEKEVITGEDVDGCIFVNKNEILCKDLSIDTDLENGNTYKFTIPKKRLIVRYCCYDGDIEVISKPGDSYFVVKAISGNPSIAIRFYSKVHYGE